MMFIIGTGMEYLPGCRSVQQYCSYSGIPLAAAAALWRVSQRRQQPEWRFAPKLDLFQYRRVDHDFVDASTVFSVFAKNSLSDPDVNRANSFGYALPSRLSPSRSSSAGNQ